MNRGKILLLLGLAFLSLYLVAASGALTQLVFNRTSAAGSAADDTAGALTLTGFNNPTIALNSTFKQTGTITNNSTQALSLSIYIDPNITATKKGATWTYTVRIVTAGGTTYDYPFSGKNAANPAGVWSTAVSIQPGAVLTIQEKLVLSATGGFTAQTLFSFSATSTSGISITINDTTAVPRRHSYTG